MDKTNKKTTNLLVLKDIYDKEHYIFPNTICNLSEAIHLFTDEFGQKEKVHSFIVGLINQTEIIVEYNIIKEYLNNNQ